MDFHVVFISIKTMFMNAIETNDQKKNLQIDFAPMVDLGFLLITFFVFTTELSKPQAFKLNMPVEGGGTQSPVSTTITLTLTGNGEINFLEGSEKHILATGKTYLYSKPSLRDQLLNKRQRIISQFGSDEQYTVLIQPTSNSSYKELVDVLDEITITDIKKYVLLADKPIK
jgi:biopolymer transport protein ExbD